jgi:2-oxoglutarate ferredoxin oxidoreductase subunit beta
MAKIREWDYNSDAPIGLGVLYKKDAPTFESTFVSQAATAVDRDKKIKAVLEQAV